MSALGLHGPAMFSDGDYRSLEACQRTGESLVVRLDQREVELEKRYTRTSKDGRNISKAYGARKWEFECMPTDKG